MDLNAELFKGSTMVRVGCMSSITFESGSRISRDSAHTTCNNPTKKSEIGTSRYCIENIFTGSHVSGSATRYQ